MCNLYRLDASQDEIAALFGARTTGGNAASEVYPGYPGLVVAEGALRSMVWGFPLAQRSKRTGEPLKPRPVNNARTDKLDSFMWRYSFKERRCLIPLTAWAEAEGPKGAMTRTWLSLPDRPIFACAGIWRGSEEWGDCYSMVMTDACGAAAECHTRMPVVLRREDWTRWQSAGPDEARTLCRPYEGAITLDRTEQPWSAR
jgi:putative SOS response-associated peptidase YedK